MTAQKGSDIFIETQISNVWTKLGALRNTSLRINNTTVDVTSADSTNRFRELLGGAGITSMTISGGGVYVGDAVVKQVLTNATAKTADQYKFVMPGLGEFVGPFVVNDLTLQGNYNDAAAYSTTFESAGAITFTAAI